MKILIITTYFPPDTAIAAIRPYMFAKHLMRRGHHVEVLCSDVINQKVDASNMYPIDGFCIHTYQNVTANTARKTPTGGRLGFLPYGIQRFLSAGYHKLMAGAEQRKQAEESKTVFARQKAVLDQLRDRQFDVVLSTFSKLENVYAGEYAAKLFGCKWVQDFRDPVTVLGKTKRQKKYYKKIQDEEIRKADLSITVSEDLAKYLSEGTGEKVCTVYNGYEQTQKTTAQTVGEELSFCYTGNLYGGRRKFTPLFWVLREMIRAGEVREDELVFHYAGNDFAELQEQAKRYHMESCLQNRGYLDRKQTERLQKTSDFYVVLSWNDKGEAVGVLTGKLYEGIRAKKPIIALISGKRPDAELSRIVERYRLGCSYEEPRKKADAKKLREYLLMQIRAKRETGAVRHEPSEEAERFFCYDRIVDDLEQLLKSLCDERNTSNEQ